MRTFIGLEIHISPDVKQKMFCACLRGNPQMLPNTSVCPICMGYPGVLPVLNPEAIISCLKICLLYNFNISSTMSFARKHYFYPDLPKGYQITQFSNPLGTNGIFHLENKDICLNRVHMEEDTARSLYKSDELLLDYNRSSNALLEMVTAPDFENSDEVTEFAYKLISDLTEYKVTKGELNNGDIRLEANVSVSTSDELPNYKVELKNINSVKFLKAAIDYEISEMKRKLAEGKEIKNETKGWHERDKKTILQRDKVGSSDYRYFPEPDIPEFEISETILTAAKLEFEKTEVVDHPYFSEISDWNLSDSELERLKKGTKFATTEDLINILSQASKADLNISDTLKLILNSESHYRSGIEGIISHSNKNLVNIESLKEKCLEVLDLYQDEVISYKSGKVSLMQFFIGQVKKRISQAQVPDITAVLESLLK